jgi:hypothetical protein
MYVREPWLRFSKLIEVSLADFFEHVIILRIFFVVKGPAADAMDTPQP